MRLFIFCWSFFLLFVLSFQPVSAAEEAAKEATTEISYYHDVRPLFQAHCQGCHQPAKQGGEYVMTSFEGLMNPGESGEAGIVPGKPEESYLISQITPGEDGAAEMPKGKPALSAPEIEKIRQWIAAGAKNDTPASARRSFDAEHPPVYTAAPVVTSLDFSPDGSLLAISGYHEVLLHRVSGDALQAGGDPAATLAGRLVGMSERIESVAFSPDGKRLAAAGGSPGRMGELQIWNLENNKLDVGLTVGYDTLYGASWSPDGKLAAFGCPDNTVRAVDSATGKQVLFNGAHADWVLDTVFSVKGDHLVTVSRDMSMKLMHVPTERFIDNITSITPGALKGGLHAVDRHPTEEQLLVGGSDGIPRIYKTFRDKARKIGDDFNLIRAFPEMPGRVFDVAYSKDATRIVAGSSLNGTGELRVYNAGDGKQIMRVELPSSGVYAVAFSPAGDLVACGGFDGLIRLYNAVSGELVREFLPITISVDAAASASP